MGALLRLCCAACAASQLVSAKKGRGGSYYSQHQDAGKRKICARSEKCKKFHVEEADDCVDQCTNEACWDTVLKIVVSRIT